MACRILYTIFGCDIIRLLGVLLKQPQIGHWQLYFGEITCFVHLFATDICMSFDSMCVYVYTILMRCVCRLDEMIRIFTNHLPSECQNLVYYYWNTGLSVIPTFDEHSSVHRMRVSSHLICQPFGMYVCLGLRNNSDDHFINGQMFGKFSTHQTDDLHEKQRTETKR